MPKLKTKPPFHPTLTGYDFTIDPPLIRSKAIRQKCLECQNASAHNVRHCHITDCPLWPWRFGRVMRADEKQLHEHPYSGDYPDDGS